jgi:hypothetical protein
MTSSAQQLPSPGRRGFVPILPSPRRGSKGSRRGLAQKATLHTEGPSMFTCQSSHARPGNCGEENRDRELPNASPLSAVSRGEQERWCVRWLAPATGAAMTAAGSGHGSAGGTLTTNPPRRLTAAGRLGLPRAGVKPAPKSRKAARSVRLRDRAKGIEARSNTMDCPELRVSRVASLRLRGRDGSRRSRRRAKTPAVLNEPATAPGR